LVAKTSIYDYGGVVTSNSTNRSTVSRQFRWTYTDKHRQYLMIPYFRLEASYRVTAEPNPKSGPLLCCSLVYY